MTAAGQSGHRQTTRRRLAQHASPPTVSDTVLYRVMAKDTMPIGSSKRLQLAVLIAVICSTNALGSRHSAEDALGSRLNISYTREQPSPSALASLFSPRMDFEQWKPLTGRGDPLHNDPTYDYEPPVLERVHYWADDAKPERETFQEKKSEVLMLGVSSRKPSVTPRQPPLPPPRRHHQFRPPPPKYEDFTYKLSDTYPMTILVPPPPPPPGHKPSLFTLDNKEIPITNTHIKETISPLIAAMETTRAPEKITSSYALQEANLIYQSSSTSQNWIVDVNETSAHDLNKEVSSDYAGWGPTTPIDVYETANESHNLVSHEHAEVRHPYSFYRPMLSEAPPPPPTDEQNSFVHFSTFLPTALPPTTAEQTTTVAPEATRQTEQTTSQTITENQDYYEDTPPPTKPTETIVFSPTSAKPTEKPKLEEEINLFSMLGPMMSMPIFNGPDRPEDNLYAHASENMQVFKERHPEDVLKLENMQTMQPPPPVKYAESTTPSHKQPYHANNILSTVEHKQPSLHTHDPYLHMRYTTPVSTSPTDSFDENKSTTEASAPMYLIIQGHSKVKTYSSKPKAGDDQKHASDNEILKPNETTEVKHLHPKEKFIKKLNITSSVRKSRDRNLKALVDRGFGSIEIQEADLGIKYDVSDGSDVPIELYRKGIVDNVETAYKTGQNTDNREKRQIDLEDLIPFDEDTIEEFVYNYLEGKKNDTSITGMIAQAVTSDAADAVDELEDADSGEDSPEDEDR